MPKQMNTPQSINKKDIEDNMYVAALSYLGILCFIPLFLKRDSAFTQSHAKQGLLLLIAEVIGLLLPPIYLLLVILFVITSAYGIMTIFKGQEWEIPIIGKYAGKFNI